MNTLREIGDFVGIPQGAAARTSGPTVGLRNAARLVTLLSNDERSSMRAMIVALQNLPPVTLTADLVGDHSGEEPFEPVVRLQPSYSAVTETLLRYEMDGRVFSSYDLDVGGGDFHPSQLGPGQWLLAVKRAGIGSTGFVRLERSFDVTVTARPSPVVPEPTPLHPIPPLISVNNVGDGTFKVSGSNFQPGATVTIRVVDADHPLGKNLFFTNTADGGGKITDVPTGSIGFGGERIAFSAQDGRVDGGIAVTSNIVTVTVPFPKPK